MTENKKAIDFLIEERNQAIKERDQLRSENEKLKTENNDFKIAIRHLTEPPKCQRYDIEKYRKGLVCLVPKPEEITADSMLLSSHEKTLCDCQVLEIFAAYDSLREKLGVAREALYAIEEMFNAFHEYHEFRAKIFNIMNEALAKLEGEK